MPFSTHNASQTSLTPAGGLFIDLTTAMSAGVRVLRAATAEFMIGIASARSASHSSLIAFAWSACLFATAWQTENTQKKMKDNKQLWWCHQLTKRCRSISVASGVVDYSTYVHSHQLHAHYASFYSEISICTRFRPKFDGEFETNINIMQRVNMSALFKTTTGISNITLRTYGLVNWPRRYPKCCIFNSPHIQISR